MSTPRLFLDPHAREEGLLAPYALRALDTRGREVPEEESAQRSAFQRDRDRIVHCTAFRRLEYKTQVFVNHEGDLFRTRLTVRVEDQRGRPVRDATVQIDRKLHDPVSRSLCV